MRIGLTGGGATADRIVSQASQAEADGFTSMWYPGAAGAGDPPAAEAPARAGRPTAAVSALGAPGRITLGVGPSHRVVVEDWLGLSYDTPGLHTDEYVQIPTALLRGQPGSL